MVSLCPKVSLREQFKGLSSTQFSNYIGVLSNLVPLSKFTESGAAALIATIPQLRKLRTDISLLALRPAVISEAPRNRSFSQEDIEILKEAADAIIANTYDEIESFKTLTNVEIVFISTSPKESYLSVAKRAFSSGAHIVMFKNSENRNITLFYDLKRDIPLTFKLVLEESHLPAPRPDIVAGSLDPLVKVCGIKTVEAASVALENGADMIGMILVPGRSRTVDVHSAMQISSFVRNFDKTSNATGGSTTSTDKVYLPQPGQNIFDFNSTSLRSRPRKRPLIVGVFRNQPLAIVLELQERLSLDIVQLHGDEPLEWCRLIPVPVIKRFTPGTARFEECLIPGYFKFALLDGELGGEGKMVDRTQIESVIERGARFILAGGLTPENVGTVIKTPGILGVDVSGGVETKGVKDLEKVKDFVINAKQA